MNIVIMAISHEKQGGCEPGSEGGLLETSCVMVVS